MKAKEYYEKYQSVIITELKNKKVNMIQELVAELYNETIQLIAVSKSRSDSTVIGICKQQCQKYNRIASLFQHNYGRPVLRMNAFEKVLIHHIPELEGRL